MKSFAELSKRHYPLALFFVLILNDILNPNEVFTPYNWALFSITILYLLIVRIKNLLLNTMFVIAILMIMFRIYGLILQAERASDWIYLFMVIQSITLIANILTSSDKEIC